MANRTTNMLLEFVLEVRVRKLELPNFKQKLNIFMEVQKPRSWGCPHIETEGIAGHVQPKLENSVE